MRYGVTFVLALLLSSAAFVRPLVAQESNAVKTMAGILLTVDHFPDDDQKKTLTALAAESTTTTHEKVLIQALMTMQHQVAAADKPKVEAIVQDEAAPEGVKSLPTILGGFLHMASDVDKATLEKLGM